MTCKETWQGCYDAGWKGLITDESFAHPAKFARNLIGRIYRHMLDRGWLAPGMTVVDPFGGVALGALDAMANGLHWVGCELEPRFSALGNANIAEWVRRYGHSAGWGSARLLNGDSRRLCEVIYGDSTRLPDMQETDLLASAKSVRQVLFKDESDGATGQRDVGRTGGERFSDTIKAKSEAVVISSPPYAQNRMDGGDVVMKKPARKGYNYTPGGDGVHAQYGTTPGQLGSMKAGSVDAVLSSPPYADRIGNENGIDYSKAKDPTTSRTGSTARDALGGPYGSTSGNLGNLRPGSVDSVISSPPYAESLSGDGTAKETAAESHAKRSDPKQGGSLGQSQRHQGYGGPENLGNLKAGSVEAVVGSPPFMLSDQRMKDPNKAKEFYRADGTSAGLGKSAGQPYGDESPTNSTIGGDRTSADAKAAQSQRVNGIKNIGNIVSVGNGGELVNTETFWHAAREIVQQCHAILRPGGVAAWVCKDFVRNKQRVPFSADWLKLCEACGFELVEWVKASLVKDLGQHSDLYGDVHHRKVERKSFFRRLAEKKGSPRIDHEDVIFVKRLCR